uniref:C-type lectin domain-containing protein n=1 Tax=Maylandia zebra TaxID=106582 RepID=A0A3P9DIB5_9CICH
MEKALLSNLTSIHLLPAKSHVVKRSPRSPCCPGGWTKYGHRCFFFNSTVASWADAEKLLVHGANLASVHSIREYQKIQRLTAHYGYPQIWIGGTDAPQEGIWLWSDGTSFHYSHWCPGEPNNFHNQHCIQMNYGGSKCWDDVWCDAHLPSVCAKKV